MIEEEDMLNTLEDTNLVTVRKNHDITLIIVTIIDRALNGGGT